MKTKIIQIGNSKGIRIPKPLLEQSGLGEEVELQVKRERIVISPARPVRAGWSEKFKEMASENEDGLLDAEIIHKQSQWDDEDWVW